MSASLLTTGELARIIRVSNPTINRWKAMGIITPTIEIGATIRWNPEAVIQALRDNHAAVPKRHNPKATR
jgi:DNA-binding transcriptional MerR regulator